MLKAIKKIDIFGQNVEFRFQNKTKFKTLFGSTLTALIFIATSILLWAYFVDMV